MWAITVCFNPAGYKNKYDHFQRFSTRVRAQGAKLLAVELAIRGQPFSLTNDVADRIVRLSSDTVLWHKERLLNVAITALPNECDKVTWLDADLLFDNPDWISETCALLERYPVVQPFQYYIPMPREVLTVPEDPSAMEIMPSFAFARLTNDLAYEARGLSGGAWAARRSLIEKHGFYDRFVLGGGDAAMAWSMYGLGEQWPGAWGWFKIVLPDKLIQDLAGWSEAFYRDVQGSVFFTRGNVFHLWHGDRKRRRYVLRFVALRRAEFDPLADIALDENQCWRWNSDKPALHKDVEDYFWARKEEG
jgi:hypothetical protein